MSGLNEPIFGKLSQEDVFAVADDSTVGFATVQEASASAPTLAPFPIPPAPFPTRKSGDGSVATGRPGELKLVSMHFDRAAERALLYYKSDDDETFEIFKYKIVSASEISGM